jgi:hypothetical protein
MNQETVKQHLTDANDALNRLIDTTYADAKKTGKGFGRLAVLGRAAKSIEQAGRHMDNVDAQPKKAAKKS